MIFNNVGVDLRSSPGVNWNLRNPCETEEFF